MVMGSQSRSCGGGTASYCCDQNIITGTGRLSVVFDCYSSGMTSNRTARPQDAQQAISIRTNISVFSLRRGAAEGTFELSDDFFKDFKSLRWLRLNLSITILPRSVGKLSELEELNLIGSEIYEIEPKLFWGLRALGTLIIDGAPSLQFDPSPFRHLKLVFDVRLSGIREKKIPADFFEGASGLQTLQIEGWPCLATIHAEVFDQTPVLRDLLLKSLPKLKELPRGLFENLTTIRRIFICRCGLQHLPVDLWPENEQQTRKASNYFGIVQSELEALPANILRGATDLENLDLRENRIRELNFLSNLPALQWLDIFGNDLKRISKINFRDLTSLIYLNLGKNRIGYIETGSFDSLGSLESLILSDNNLHRFGAPGASITAANPRMTSIHLSNNRITSFPDIPFDELPRLRILKLDGNSLANFSVPLFSSERTEVFLQNNSISHVGLKTLEEIRGKSYGLHEFFIDNNPFQCDASNYIFLDYVQNYQSPEVALFRDLENCICENTKEKIAGVKVDELFHQLIDCPAACECRSFPSNDSTHIRCRDRKLAGIPRLPVEVTHLDFEGNALTNFPEEISRYKSLLSINLNRNRLRSIDNFMQYAPPSLHDLHIEFNELERLGVDPESQLSFFVDFSNNPWVCDCDMRNFKLFLDRNRPKILNYPLMEYTAFRNQIDQDTAIDSQKRSNPQQGGTCPHTRTPVFEIEFSSAGRLTIQCTTDAPHVAHLLTVLNVVGVTSLFYIDCEIPEGPLSLSQILDGNSLPLSVLSLANPLKVPDRILKRSLFANISADVFAFVVLLEDASKSLDFSDDFFEDFTSLKRLDLRCALRNLNSLQIYDTPVESFAWRPFSGLDRLNLLTLSGFHASKIPDGVFHGLKNLQFLRVERWSNLSSIDAGAFSRAPSLFQIQLDSLPRLEKLPRGILDALGSKSVRSILISRSALKRFPVEQRPGTGRIPSFLSTIEISHSEFESLPENFFRGNEKLQSLNLARNRLRQLGNSLNNIPRLATLDLLGNEIESILRHDFINTSNLMSLDLSHNNINFIESRSFEDLRKLEFLDLSDNKIQHFGFPRALISLSNSKIRRVLLSNNRITAFPNIPFNGLEHFSLLDLDNNLITDFEVPLLLDGETMVSLRNNRIKRVSMRRLKAIRQESRGEDIFLIDGNPFECTGHNHDFLSYLQNSMRSELAEFENLENCFCNDTEQSIVEVDLDKLSLRVDDCPEACECLKFPASATTKVFCRYEGLDEVPVLPSGVTDLDFEGNVLSAFPEGISVYQSLRSVNLNKNRLMTLDNMLPHFPPNLRYLYVEYNKLERLNIDPTETPKLTIALSNNPWICDCDTKDFRNFLSTNSPRILNISEIRCRVPFEVDGRQESSLSRIPWEVICPVGDWFVWIPASGFLLVLGLLLGAMILYFKNRSLATFIYVHFNRLFRCLSSEPHSDERKIYDAFLSYSSSDREVAMEILNELESHLPKKQKRLSIPFRLAFHERDFIAGQAITWNISNIVQNSKRTIVILSQEFLDSSWFAIEFGAAYNQMLDDHANHLIVVLRGVIPTADTLSENLRAVLSTKTYLVWGERWFWKKLLYAMPHKGLK
ncbi:uncharacterized protein LOC100905187 [Galendromus occidentalis]|uniref:Uncharacterized protein LOC100905187 n=1 Tax=Galendromus occidentalis TaxID=34638 RepID=A0AAJ7SEJ2_9ACAR|nr:uncharacterized protein LOC100905187 [Galendromus occidentalis]